MRTRPKDRKVARGIRWTFYGWRVYASVHGKGKWHRIKDREHTKTLEQLKTERANWNAEARKPVAKAPPDASFAEEARTDYYPAIAAMPDRKTRERHIELWIAALAELLGADAPRRAIEPKHIMRIRDRWLTVGPKVVQRKGGRVTIAAPLSAQTVALRMRALENLWTVLDGTRAPNPVREVAEPEGPTRPPKGLAYPVVDAILAKMPDTRGDRPVTATLFARAIAYTGFSHGEIHALNPATDLHLNEPRPWVWVAGRKKGRGTKGEPQPLTAAGAAAIRALADAGLLGRKKKPSASSIRQAVHRACERANVDPVTTYVFRHSYATEVLLRTGSLDATQQLMRHKDRRTSAHYSAAALDPARAALVAQLEATGAFARNLPEGKKSPKKRTKPDMPRHARTARARRKSSRKR